MTPAASLDWVYTLAGLVLAASGVVVLLWAVWWDRSRGRRRCPRCWYEMAGVPGLKCPECGREAKSEKRLHRTRRRWRWAVLACLAVIGGWVVTAVPDLRTGWPAAVPSWVLANIARTDGTGMWSPAGMAGMVVVGRGTQRVRGMDTRRPEPWTGMDGGRMHGWAGRRFLRRCMTEAGWTPELSVWLPEAWAVGERVKGSFGGLKFAGGDMLEVQFRGVGDASWVPASSGPQTFMLGARGAPAGSVPIEMRLMLVDRPVLRAIGLLAAAAPPAKGARRFAEELMTAQFEAPVRLQGTASDFLDPVRGPEADGIVLRAVDPRLIRTEDGELFLGINDTSRAAVWGKVDFGIKFRAEVLVGSEVMARGESGPEWGRAVWKDWVEVPLEWVSRKKVEAALAREPGSVRLRITGARDLACAEYLRNPYNKPFARCWEGVLEVPARVLPPGTTAKEGP